MHYYLRCLQLSAYRVKKLFCPLVYLHREKLSLIHETKYLGCSSYNDQTDDVEVSKKYALFIYDNVYLLYKRY